MLVFLFDHMMANTKVSRSKVVEFIWLMTATISLSLQQCTFDFPVLNFIPKKKLKIKVFWHRILDKKCGKAYVCPPPSPPHQSGARGSKDDTVEKS